MCDLCLDVCSSDLVAPRRGIGGGRRRPLSDRLDAQLRVHRGDRIAAILADDHHVLDMRRAPAELMIGHVEGEDHILLEGEGVFARHLRRPEENTSELQSLMSISYAVSCLKNKKHNKH